MAAIVVAMIAVAATIVASVMRVGIDNGGRLGNDDDSGYPRLRQPEEK